MRHRRALDLAPPFAKLGRDRGESECLVHSGFVRARDGRPVFTRQPAFVEPESALRRSIDEGAPVSVVAGLAHESERRCRFVDDEQPGVEPATEPNRRSIVGSLHGFDRRSEPREGADDRIDVSGLDDEIDRRDRLHASSNVADDRHRAGGLDRLDPACEQLGHLARVDAQEPPRE